MFAVAESLDDIYKHRTNVKFGDKYLKYLRIGDYGYTDKDLKKDLNRLKKAIQQITKLEKLQSSEKAGQIPEFMKVAGSASLDELEALLGSDYLARRATFVYNNTSNKRDLHGLDFFKGFLNKMDAITYTQFVIAVKKLSTKLDGGALKAEMMLELLNNRWVKADFKKIKEFLEKDYAKLKKIKNAKSLRKLMVLAIAVQDKLTEDSETNMFEPLAEAFLSKAKSKKKSSDNFIMRFLPLKKAIDFPEVDSSVRGYLDLRAAMYPGYDKDRREAIDFINQLRAGRDKKKLSWKIKTYLSYCFATILTHLNLNDEKHRKAFEGFKTVLSNRINYDGEIAKDIARFVYDNKGRDASLTVLAKLKTVVLLKNIPLKTFQYFAITETYDVLQAIFESNLPEQKIKGIIKGLNDDEDLDLDNYAYELMDKIAEEKKKKS